VLAEIEALACARGARPETLAGLTAAGNLGEGAEAADSVALLAGAARAARLDAPALDGLAALLEGRIGPEQWTATFTEPPSPPRSPGSVPRPAQAGVGS
jgi:glycerol-3-phosphate dehydrogenase (NAD(P)+)